MPTVFCLGPRGTFSEWAAFQYLKQESLNFNLVTTNTILDIFKLLNETKDSLGCVPVENIYGGSVESTLDNMIAYPHIFIINEIFISVKHCLLSPKGLTLNAITDVYSHPQALEQCRSFLQNNLNHVNLHPTNSTAKAATIVIHKTNAACIGHQFLIQHYPLVSLQEDIQDLKDKTNITRFWIIQKNTTLPLKKINFIKPKTSIVFSIKDEPKSLVTVLDCFSSQGLNFRDIVLRANKKDGLFFFIDIDSDIQNPITEQASKKAALASLSYRCLGNYNSGNYY